MTKTTELLGAVELQKTKSVINVLPDQQRQVVGQRMALIENCTELRTALLACLDRSFSRKSAPLPETMIYTTDWESSDILHVMRSNEFHSLGVAAIPQFINSLRVFNPVGIRHVLSDYLQYGLGSNDGTANGYILYFLSQPANSTNCAASFVAMFSNDQRLAIMQYLDYLEKCDPEMSWEQEKIDRAREIWRPSQQS